MPTLDAIGPTGHPQNAHWSRLRIKTTKPPGDGDGVIVGTQSQDGPSRAEQVILLESAELLGEPVHGLIRHRSLLLILQNHIASSLEQLDVLRMAKSVDVLERAVVFAPLGIRELEKVERRDVVAVREMIGVVNLVDGNPARSYKGPSVLQHPT